MTIDRPKLIHLCPAAPGPGWTARWGAAAESGSTPGEAFDAVLEHAPPEGLDRLIVVVREPAPASSHADRRPIRLRACDRCR